MTTPRFMAPTERGAHRNAVLRGPKPLLVGECNPYGANPKYSLFPYPKGSSGERLCFKIMCLTRREYLERFDRVNLCAGKWSIKEARARAEELRSVPGRTIVLLGAKVATAFGRKFEPFRFDETPDYYSPKASPLSVPILRRLVILPHPSGLSRTWNEPGAYERARTVLKEAGVL